MGLSTALKVAAVARMARGQEPLVRSASSFLDRETRWDAVRGVISRVVASDPDITFYFKGVAINNTLSSLQKVKALAETALISLPGTLLPQRPITSRSLTNLAKAGRAAQTAVKGGLDPRASSWFSGQSWDPLLSEMGKALDAGGQTGPRGVEAQKKFTRAISDLVDAWDDFSGRLRVVTLLSLGSEPLIRSLAVQSSLDKTLKTLEMGAPEDRQTEYINQLTAGLAAVKNMSRDFSFSRRLLVQDGKHQFPEEFRATPIIQSAQIIGFSFTEAKTGLLVPPSMLNIKVQDRVLLNQTFLLGSPSKFVASVSGSQITLNSPIPEQEIYTLEIIPLGGILLNELVIRLTSEFFLDPPTQPGARRVNYLREFTEVVSQISKLAQAKENVPFLALSLYNLINSIDVPSTKAAAAFAQLSKLSPANYPTRMTQLFLLGNPLSSLIGTKQTALVGRARLITKMLRSEGWLRAARELARSGSLGSVLGMTSSSATFEGTIADLESSVRGSAEFYNAGIRT